MELELNKLLDEAVTTSQDEDYAQEMKLAVVNLADTVFHMGMKNYMDIIAIHEGEYDTSTLDEAALEVIDRMKCLFGIIDHYSEKFGLDLGTVYKAIVHDIVEFSKHPGWEDNEDEGGMTYPEEDMDIALERVLRKCDCDSEEESLMKAVELGILPLKEAANELGMDIDDFYMTMLRTGHKVPFYMSLDEILIVDFSLPYAVIVNAFSQIEDAVLELFDKIGVDYDIALCGCDLYARDSRMPEDVSFYISSEFSQLDMTMKYYMEDTVNGEINDMQEMFWEELEEILR